MAVLLSGTTIGGHVAVHANNISTYALTSIPATISPTNIYVGNAIYFGGANNYFNWDGARINSNVGIQSAVDMRAPIFYDSNDTTYYLDPDSTSRSFRGRGEILLGPNTSGEYTRIGGNGGAVDYATMSSSNGNLHIDCKDGFGLYLNYYSRDTIYLGQSGAITSDGAYYNGTSAAANSVAWSNVSGRPSSLSEFTNNLTSFPNRIEFQYSSDRYSQAWRNSSTGAYWWVTTDDTQLGLHRNGDGDKFYFSNGGDFYSTTNGWLSTALAGKLATGGTAANSSQLEGFSAYALVTEARGAHSGSDFINGTLVTTDINANGWAGNSFVMEVSGKSYGSGTPFKLVMEGYLYADTIINVSAMSYGYYFPSPVKVMRYNGNIAFWWPRGSYWNSFQVHVRNADGDSWNRVTGITDSVDPASADKKISITPTQVIHTGNIASQSVSYAVTSGTSSATTQTNFSELFIEDVAVATKEFVTSQGYLTSLPSHNHDDRYYTESESDGRFQPLENQRLSTSNGPTFTEVYNNGWFRTTGFQGLYNPTNNAHFYPNNASYGSWRIDGSRNGWAGLHFESGATLMMNSNESGVHREGYGWQFRWDNGTMYCHKNSYGGGTAATVWDSSNAPRANFGNLMYYQGFELDANTMATNSTGFTYANNAPFYGPIARFSTGGGYDLWIGGAYTGGNAFYLRTRNGDAGTFNAWREIITSGNIASQSVSYADESGYSASSGSVEWTSVQNKPATFPPSSHNHDDRYYTETESDNRYVPYGSITGSFGLNDNKLYLRTNGDNNHYLWNAGDDWEELNAYEGTGFRITSNGGSVGILYVYGASNGGYTYSPYSFRAPIFYDSEDTAYYLDPNGTSNLSRVLIPNASSGASLIVGANNTSRVYNDDARKGLVVNADYYPHIYVNALSNASNNVHGAVISMTGVLSAGGYRRWGMGIANTDPSALSWGWWDNESNPHYSVGGSLGYTDTGSRMWLDTGGNLQTTGSMRAPIFYDSNDTAYYLNPAGGSRLRNLYVGDSGDDWSDPGGWGTQVRFSNGPHVRFVLHARTPGIEAGMYVHTPGSVFIGSYTGHSVNMMVGGNSRLLIEDGRVYSHVYMEASGSMRAPIFYDSQDTGYYVDPNGTSNLIQLTTDTRARWNMPRIWHDRSSRTSDQNYWTGSNGWALADGNWDQAWKGGFSGWDIWGEGSAHPQGGQYVHAQGIVSGQHYAASDGSSGYGWMMVGAHAATENRYWLRGKWGGTTSGWTEMMTSSNNPIAWNMDQYVRTSDSVTFGGVTSPTILVNNQSDNTKGYRIWNTSNTSVSAMFTNSANALVIGAGAFDQVQLNKKTFINGAALGVNVAASATAGRIDASNDIVAYSSSDERLKYNIAPIENALDKVKSLTGVEFDWKPEYKHAHGYEGHDTGIIAQQVEAVMPSAVRTNDTGFLAVRYEKLIGLLIEANKELAARVEELEKKIG